MNVDKNMYGYGQEIHNVIVAVDMKSIACWYNLWTRNP